MPEAPANESLMQAKPAAQGNSNNRIACIKIWCAAQKLLDTEFRLVKMALLQCTMHFHPIFLPRRILMFPNQDQISSAAKANFETQLGAVTEMVNKAFASIAQLVELNVNAAKTTLEKSSATAQQLLAAKDPQEFFAVSAAQTQPNAESAIAYSRNLASIASSAQAEFARAAEAQIAETTRKVTALIDDIAKNAPPGSENAIAMLKTTIANANAAYAQLKQTTDAMGANVSNAVNQFAQQAEKAAPRAPKK
jgi:phasin family protein